MAKRISAAEESARIGGFIAKLKKIKINRELQKLPQKDFLALEAKARENAQRFKRPDTKSEILEIMRELHLQTIIKSLWAKELQSLIDNDYSINTIVTSKVTKYRKEAENLIDPAVKELEEQYREAFNDLKAKLTSIKSAKEFQKQQKALHKNPELVEINEAKAYILKADPISRIGFACRWSITNNPEMKKASMEMQEQRKVQRLEKPVIFDQKKYIDVTRALLRSNDKRDLLIGLTGTLGRRTGEIIKTAEIEALNNRLINFSGQIKTRGKPRKPYLIPVFTDATEIVAAFNKFRKLICINKKTGQKINIDSKTLAEAHSDITDGEYHRKKRNAFKNVFKKDTKFSLRSTAGFIACKTSKPKNMSDEMFIKIYLGHDGFGSIMNYRGSQGV